MFIQNNDCILFQGDSITDCGRDRQYPDDLGHGYPFFVNAFLKAFHPSLSIEILNRGISGNRTIDLLGRLEEDCLTLQPKPDIVSFYIGVNEVIWRYKYNEPTSDIQFERNFREILSRTVDALQPRLVIMEPFVFPRESGVGPLGNPIFGIDADFISELESKAAITKALAAEFDAKFLPLFSIYRKLGEQKTSTHWAGDSIHPTPQGHVIIAKEWMNLTGVPFMPNHAAENQ